MDKDTVESLADLLVPMTAIVTIFGGLVLVGVIALRNQFRLRSQIIERGLATDPFSGPASAGRTRRWGLVLLGVGLGLLAGHLGARFAGLDPVIAYSAAVSLAVGAALLAAWRLETRGGEAP